MGGPAGELTLAQTAEPRAREFQCLLEEASSDEEDATADNAVHSSSTDLGVLALLGLSHGVQSSPCASSSVCRWGEWRSASGGASAFSAACLKGNGRMRSRSPRGTRITSEGDAAAGRLPVSAAGTEDDEESSWEALPLSRWASTLVEATLISCLKKRAAAAESYRLAADLKAQEASLDEVLISERARALSSLSKSWDQKLEVIRLQKCHASQAEDYRLAANLKRQEMALRAEAPPRIEELEDVVRKKRQAVADEDYELAAELKVLEQQLEASWKSFDKKALIQAAVWASNPEKQRTHNREGRIAAWMVKLGVGEGIWDEVEASLRTRAAAT